MRKIIHSFSALAFLQTFLAKLIFRKPASDLPRATWNLFFSFDHEAAPATMPGIHQVGQSPFYLCKSPTYNYCTMRYES